MKWKKINWICHSPSPYNDFLFKYLASQLPCDFQVHFLKVSGTEHQAVLMDGVGYSWREIDTETSDSILLREARSRDVLFVVGGWDRVIFQRLFYIAKGRYIIWNDTPWLSKKRSPIKAIVRGVLLRWVFQNALAVMGTGRPALAALEKMGAAPEKLVNFPYWVEVPDEPTHSKRSGNPLVILAVGRLINLKSFDHLVFLADLLRNAGADSIVVRIAGDGPEFGNLAREIQVRGLESRVQLLGWLNNQQVRDQLRECDIFIHPSSWEPYGVVVLEAMAQAKVVITSDATMAGVDRIANSENGFVYRYGAIDELTELVLHLKDDEALRSRLGGNAFATASQWRVSRALEILDQISGIGV